MSPFITRIETLVALTIVGLCLLIGFLNPVFFTVGNLFDLLRSTTVIGIFALGVLMVIVSGGIDVSFTAVAVFSLYSTVKILLAVAPNAPIWLAFLIAAIIGLGLGLINAFFIARFKLPTLIVTLGTLSMFHGFLLFAIGNQIIRDIPPSMTAFARTSLITVPLERGVANLHPAIFIMFALAIVVWLLLDYTMLGRGVYALGGAREAAERAGFNVVRIEYFIYGFVGLLSGLAGMMFGALNRQANPQDIVGSELNVIAAVVLGGAQLTGGRGTVVGTLLGVALVVIMNNSLILIGVPSVWQRVVIGAIILIGTGIPAIQARRTGT
ncbi:MAG: ABC transporter permease [Chloroflexota bacterium]